MSEIPHIHVVAGVIWGDDGRILLSKRLEQAHMGGRWELPGGKIEAGESCQQALEREIMEELGIKIKAGEKFGKVKHQYEKKHVTLYGIHALYVTGEPECLGVAEFKWVKLDDVLSYEFPEANAKLYEYDWNIMPESFKLEIERRKSE